MKKGYELLITDLHDRWLAELNADGKRLGWNYGQTKKDAAIYTVSMYLLAYPDDMPSVLFAMCDALEK